MKQLTKLEIIAQINNLPMYEVLEVAQDCIGLLAATEPADYADFNTIPLRTVQDRLNKNNMKSLKIGSKKYPCINIF